MLRSGQATPGSGEVTGLLRAWGEGDLVARDRLMPLVYTELRRRAATYIRRERIDHTLQPTALVNEAYLRLVGQERVVWQDRAHFFGIAAQMMRRILVDYARGRGRAKRFASWSGPLARPSRERWRARSRSASSSRPF